MFTFSDFPGILGSYQRRLRGPRKFFWTASELEIVCLAFRQFANSPSSAADVANHVHSLIIVSIKCTLISNALKYCEEQVADGDDDIRSKFNLHYANKINASFHLDFDRIVARWIRFPSLAAVRRKLRDCDLLASVDIDIRNFAVSALHQQTWQFIHHRANLRNHPFQCYFFNLPAVPADSSLHKYGNCFHCGTGLDDRTDFVFVQRCKCYSCELDDDTVVCNLCSEL